MSTATLTRPVTAAGGGAPARRAVIRWAWRLFRREWRQQLLILALLTVAVAATILAAAIGTNVPPPANAGFGTADHRAGINGPDPAVATQVAAIRLAVGPVDVIEDQPLATGLAQGAILRAQDPHGAYGTPMLALVNGRYPTGPDEVAMTRNLVATFALKVGDRWQQRRLVGLVENPQNLLDNFALVAPGQLSGPRRATVLFDSRVAELTLPGGIRAETPHGSSGLSPAVVVLIFAIFGLVFVGLVAVAGFSVLAQRRLRALGMLAALGATDRHVRLVMVANGGVVGAVAAVIGAAVGLGGWIAYAPRLSTSSNHRVVWTHVPWWLPITVMILAVATAMLAARRPARTAARISTVAALSGRPPRPMPAHRSAIPGLVLVAGALVLLWYSGGWGASGLRQNGFKLGGVLGIAIGVLLLAPAGIAPLPRLAARLPVAARLALRDLGRYRARSGAALAAVSFAVLIAVVTCLLATARYADPVDYFGPNLPADQLVLYPPGTGPGTGGPQPGGDQAIPAVASSSIDAVAAAAGATDVLPLLTSGAVLAKTSGQAIFTYPGTVYVATPEVLRHYGVDPARIDPDALLITARPGLDRAAQLQLRNDSNPHQDACRPPECVANPRIQEVRGLPPETSAPNLLITQRGLDVLHLTSVPAGWLVRAPHALDPVHINAARQAASTAGLTIETKSQAPSLAQLRNYVTGAGILLALAVLAMTVGLIRSEATGDLRTLAANGASGLTRRTITAVTAGTLGLIGGLLGTSVAYLAVLAIFRSQLSERMSDPPVLDLVLVVAGLPVLAAVAGWLGAGREPPLVSRTPID
jgi:putative ABC transport system permease protein